MTSKEFQLLFYAVRALHPAQWSLTAKVPLAIAKQETGHFTSHAFDSYNNLFGMTAPAARETTATNKGTGKVATFASVFDSMTDFFLFCDNWVIKNDADLQKFIDDLRYNQNPRYPAVIAQHVAKVTAEGGYLPSLPFSPIVVGGAATLSVVALVKALSSK